MALKTNYIKHGEQLFEVIPPTPTETERGGIIASPKTDADTIEAKIGEDGKLYVNAASDGGVGENVEGQEFTIITGYDGEGGYTYGRVIAGKNAEVFNDYNSNAASGIYSHAEGRVTQASGAYSHAEGYENNASGDCAHVEGNYNDARGNCSHAEGSSNKALGLCSHAEGEYTIASGENQHVQGKYNIEDTNEKYAHIVGNGRIDESDGWELIRSNAHTLDWEGNAWYQGDVYVGGTSQDDGEKLMTQSYIEEKWFEETGGDTLTWDGNTEGREIVDLFGDGSMMFCHVSDVPLSISDVSNGGVCELISRDMSKQTFDDMVANEVIDGVFTIMSAENGGGCLVVENTGVGVDTPLGVFNKAGIYFMYMSTDGVMDDYVSSLTINGYTGFKQSKIKKEYLPDNNDIDVESLELITIDDIDAICGSSIVAASEVTY